MPSIEGYALYEVVGKRRGVVAPTANTGVRPAETREDILLLMAGDGVVGATSWSALRDNVGPADLEWLVGLDPASLFTWRGGVVDAVAPAHRDALAAARSLDIALLDLCAQQMGVPLWRVLGEAARERVPAYDCSVRFEDLTGAESSLDDVVLAARDALARGHMAIKVHVGRGRRWMEWPDCTERDIAVCRAVRRAVGPDVALVIDGGHGYADYIDDAVDFVVETAACRPAFVQSLVTEEWLPQLHGAVLERGVQVSLASGAGLRTLGEFEDLYSRSPIDVLLVDVVASGLLEARSIARFAAVHGMRVALDPGSDTCLGVCAAAHLGLTLEALAGCGDDAITFDDYCAPELRRIAGELEVGRAPGLGVRAFDPRTANCVERG